MSRWVVKFKKRWVEEVTIDGVDTKDYPDFVDTYVAHGVWAGTDIELTDTELAELTDELYSDGTLNEMAHSEVF